MEPASNNGGASNNMYGREGCRYPHSTVFKATIHPDRDPVAIPDEFLQNWKDDIRGNSSASLRDPVGNFFAFEIAKILPDSYLLIGKCVSKVCGLTQSQQVIFDYILEYNQFNMRFVDENENDISYLGIHYPVNYHQQKLANPDLLVLPRLFKIASDDDNNSWYIPFNFMVSWTNARFSSNGSYSAADRHGRFQAMYQGELRHTWDQVVSKKFVEGKSMINFPAYVCIDCPFRGGQEIVVVNDDTNEQITCIVRKFKNNGTPRYSLAGGIYKFVKDMGLNVNDKLVYVIDNPPRVLHVRVVKRNSGA